MINSTFGRALTPSSYEFLEKVRMTEQKLRGQIALGCRILAAPGHDDFICGTARRATVEWPIHTEVLRLRPELSSVIHTQPPHSIAIAASGRPLGPGFAREHDVRPPGVPRFTQTGELISTTGLGGQRSPEIRTHRHV